MGSDSKTLEAVRKRKTQNITSSVRIKQTKMIFSLIGMVLLQSVGAKICWKECASDTSALQNVNIEGCRRRASYPHRQTINVTFFKGLFTNCQILTFGMSNDLHY